MNLQVPVRSAGPLDASAAPGNSPFKLAVDVFNLAQGATLGAMTEVSSNFVSAALSGSVGADNSGKGKVTASWSAPGSSCDSGVPGSPCATGTLTMTFNVTLPQ